MADYLSCNVFHSIDIFSEDLFNLQKQDQFCNTVRKFLKDGSLPLNKSQVNSITEIRSQCFIENDVFWRRMKRNDMPTRTVLVVPRSLSHELVKEAHDSLFAGHNGVKKDSTSIHRMHLHQMPLHRTTRMLKIGVHGKHTNLKQGTFLHLHRLGLKSVATSTFCSFPEFSCFF